MKTKEITDALKAVRGHTLTARRVIEAREADAERTGFEPSHTYKVIARNELSVAQEELRLAKKLLAKLP